MNIRPKECPCGAPGVRVSVGGHYMCQCSDLDCTLHKFTIPFDEWNRWNRRTPPAGWKLVPIEPTRKMVDAVEDKWSGLSSGAVEYVWSGMLSAAPKNDAPRQEGEKHE